MIGASGRISISLQGTSTSLIFMFCGFACTLNNFVGGNFSSPQRIFFHPPPPPPPPTKLSPLKCSNMCEFNLATGEINVLNCEFNIATRRFQLVTHTLKVTRENYVIYYSNNSHILTQMVHSTCTFHIVIRNS